MDFFLFFFTVVPADTFFIHFFIKSSGERNVNVKCWAILVKLREFSGPSMLRIWIFFLDAFPCVCFPSNFSPSTEMKKEMEPLAERANVC